jgi:Flp pilus assembly protein TadG
MKFLARLRILCKANDGTALVEMALVVPVLLLLVFGAVDFGRAYYVKIEVTNAAHAGAEYGSQYPKDTAGITTAAKQSASDLSNLTVPTIAYGCECSDGSSYSANCAATLTCASSSSRGTNVVNRVQVTATSVYTTLVPWRVIPSSFTLTSTATIRGNY